MEDLSYLEGLYLGPHDWPIYVTSYRCSSGPDNVLKTSHWICLNFVYCYQFVKINTHIIICNWHYSESVIYERRNILKGIVPLVSIHLLHISFQYLTLVQVAWTWLGMDLSAALCLDDGFNKATSRVIFFSRLLHPTAGYYKFINSFVEDRFSLKPILLMILQLNTCIFFLKKTGPYSVLHI